MSVRLRVRVQPQHGPSAEYDLAGSDIVIGRSTSAAIVIQDTRVSRQHARLVRRDDGWWVEDLGARNPTLLNGEPVGDGARLHDGDRLDIGDSILRFVGDSDSAATEQDQPGRAGTSAATLPSPVTRDAARMSTINEIHRAIAEPISLNELLDLILARCFDALRPEEGAVMLRDANGEMAIAASRRLGGDGSVTVPRRLVDEVAGKAVPALVMDAMFDERFAGSQSVVTSGMRSVVAAPLVDAEGTLGLIVLFSRLAVRPFAQQDLDMLVSIASAAALRVRNVALADELAERRVIEHELALAQDVQTSLLPRDPPQRGDLAIGARLKAARSVGGDLYDFALDGDRLWFIVADVAGKSIAAAIYMAIVRTLFRATARGSADVADVASRMNEELSRENTRAMFVTAIVGRLDLLSGDLALVDAGHGPVLLTDADSRVGDASVPKSIAFGVLPGAAYSAASTTLPRGATLVLYTDGVTDARNVAGEMFGAQRLRSAVAAGPTRSPQDLVDAVMASVDAFSAGAPPDDDVTLFALRYDRVSMANGA